MPGPFLSAMQNIVSTLMPQQQAAPPPAAAPPITPVGAPGAPAQGPFTSNVPFPQVQPGPFGNIFGPLASARSMALGQYAQDTQNGQFNAGAQKSWAGQQAESDILNMAGKLLDQGLAPNAVMSKVLQSPEFVQAMSDQTFNDQLDKLFTGVSARNTPAVAQVAAGNSPVTIQPGQGAAGVTVGKPVPTPAMQNDQYYGAGSAGGTSAPGIPLSDNPSSEELALNQLVKTGVVPRDLAVKSMANGIVAIPDYQNGVIVGQHLVDKFTGQRIGPVINEQGNPLDLPTNNSLDTTLKPGQAPNNPTASPPIPQIPGAPPPPTAPNTNEVTFFQQRGAEPGLDFKDLNPTFAGRAYQAISAAEAATGQHATITSGYRSYAEQSQLYANYKAGKGGLAAPPGQSYHESGNAIDIAPGPVLDWLHANGSKYGVEFLSGNAYAADPVHMQEAGLNGSPSPAGPTGTATASTGTSVPQYGPGKAAAQQAARNGTSVSIGGNAAPQPPPINYGPPGATPPNVGPAPGWQPPSSPNDTSQLNTVNPVGSILKDPSTMIYGTGVIPALIDFTSGFAGQINPQAANPVIAAQRAALDNVKVGLQNIRVNTRLSDQQYEAWSQLIPSTGDFAAGDPVTAATQLLNLRAQWQKLLNDNAHILNNPGLTTETKNAASNAVRSYTLALGTLPDTASLAHQLDDLTTGKVKLWGVKQLSQSVGALGAGIVGAASDAIGAVPGVVGAAAGGAKPAPAPNAQAKPFPKYTAQDINGMSGEAMKALISQYGVDAIPPEIKALMQKRAQALGAK